MAIGALDPADAPGVNQHLLVCRACRLELERLNDLVNLVGFAAPQVDPPPALRESLLSRLDTSEAPPVRERAIWRWVVSVAAALIIVLLAGNIALQLRDTAPPATPTSAAANGAAPALVWYDLAATGPSAGSAHGVLCAQQSGRLAWLIVQDLPVLPPGRVYQAWLGSGDRRISAGIFTVDAQGRGFLTIRPSDGLERYATLGVTVEPAGGSPAPTGDRYLLGSL